jgi:ferredoxin
MEKVRTRRPQPVEVEKCPACGGCHSFNLTAVVDELVGGMFMMTIRTETMACSVTCPVKGVTIVIDVPVTLMSSESLIGVR